MKRKNLEFLKIAIGVTASLLIPSLAFGDGKVRKPANSDNQGPKIISVKGRVGTIVLGNKVEEALHKYDSAFQLLTACDFTSDVRKLFHEDSADETPMAIVGKFNTDGTRDIVLMGTSHSELLILGILSSGDGYTVVPIERSASSIAEVVDNSTNETESNSDECAGTHKNQDLDRYLSLVRAAKPGHKYNDGIKRFSTDALQIEVFGADSLLKYFAKGKFHTWNP